MTVSEMARALGRRGGRARGQRLAASEKKRIASLGGKARGRSLQAARRIDDNLRYAAAVDELRGQPVVVKRLRGFAGPLPGIFPGLDRGSAPDPGSVACGDPCAPRRSLAGRAARGRTVMR